MKKFWIMLLKEIRELLTLQMILPFIIVIIVFSMVGKIMNSEQEKQSEDLHVYILDLDNSDYSQNLTKNLTDAFSNATLFTDETEQSLLTKMKNEREQSLIVIPEDFNETLLSGNSPTVTLYSRIYNFSFFSNIGITQLSTLKSAIDEITTTYLLSTTGSIDNPEFYKHPILSKNIVMVKDFQSEIDPNAILTMISTQSMFVPIVLFMVITLAAQLVATSVATEKENKTLETLLSAPISRKAIVAAKLVGAGCVSLCMAGAYLYGMQSFMTGITGGFLNGADTGAQKAMEQLHLTLSLQDYSLLGVSIFLAILTALSMAFIIGAFSEDSKSAQSAIAPVMLMLLLPYLLTMFLDISALTGWMKVLLFALPFTHTFTAMSNLFAGNYTAVLIGDAYLLLIIIITVMAAGKIFSSDTILTFKMPSFGKKR